MIKIKVWYQEFIATIKDLRLFLDTIKTEFKTNHKTQETVDSLFYEIELPGYAQSDLQIKIYSQNVINQYSMVIHMTNELRGSKVFSMSLEPNLDIMDMEYSMLNGILYLAFRKVKAGVLLVDLELGKNDRDREKV